MKRSVAAPELQNQIRRQYCREHKLVPHLCVLAPTQNSVGLRITEFGVNGVERSAFQERIVFGNLCSSLSTAFSVLASCGVEAETSNVRPAEQSWERGGRALVFSSENPAATPLWSKFRPVAIFKSVSCS